MKVVSAVALMEDGDRFITVVIQTTLEWCANVRANGYAVCMHRCK